MKKVYSADNPVMVGHMQSLLEQAGIDSEIRNLALGGALGELPPIECWPEVWVHRDEDYERALSLVEQELHKPPTNAEAWHCRCGETIEGQFSHCWHCGRERPTDSYK